MGFLDAAELLFELACGSSVHHFAGTLQLIVGFLSKERRLLVVIERPLAAWAARVQKKSFGPGSRGFASRDILDERRKPHTLPGRSGRQCICAASPL